MKPGESTAVGYKFTVGAGKGIDITKSSIVDYVDSNVFDTSDLEAIKGGLTATYDYWRTLDGSSFDVSLNDAGDLVIKLNDAGIALVNGWGANKQFELNIVLTTKPVVGKQTLQITNKATLFGTDGKAMYWSEASSTATSYGDEAEIRKEVRDTPNTAWTQNLRAELSPDGTKLLQDKFVYNVALIAHGKYTGVEIFDVVDVLPAGIEFLGFVDDANIDDGANPKAEPIDLKGNVQARFDAPTVDAPQGKVVLFQKDGTVLDSSQGEASANLLVRITDFTSDAAIVNSIGSKKASITPSSGYPLSIAKLNSADDTVAISDETAKFQILNADSSVAVDNVFVQDNALRVLVDGVAKNVTVPKPGTYTVKEIKAPAGYATTEETIEVVVATDGSSKSVSFYNTPIKTYAVGDVVWVDTDKNGLQGEDEFLKDVVVTLLDGTGTPVATTKTDSSGWYMFDSLPAGEYQVKFELTSAQLEIYDFTTANSGDDDATDSDADPATGLTPKFTLDDSNKSLTKDYRYDYAATEGIDPTWDAGVVLKPVVEPTPTEEPTTPAPTEEPTTPAPTEEPTTPAPTQEPTTPAPTEEPTTPAPTTPAPTEEPTTPAPTQEPTTPAPTEEPTTPAPTQEPTTPAPTEEPTTPTPTPKVSVGDYVWLDSDRDGVQDWTEHGIQNVVLTIVDPDGKPVTDVFGNVVKPTKTDKNGKYIFENLPVLKDGQSYTVKIDQVASKVILAPYAPTKENVGSRDKDSSTWEASSKGLTNDGDHDPTLDFGFVEPVVEPTPTPTVEPTTPAPTMPAPTTPAPTTPAPTVEPTMPAPTTPAPTMPAPTMPAPIVEPTMPAPIVEPTMPAPTVEPTMPAPTVEPTMPAPTVEPTTPAPTDTPKVSVGDFVWVDNNRDGVQDEGEKGIKGVVLMITGPDGKPVTDVSGKPVGPVTTDENGKYSFENLPALKDGESYTVSIDKDASKEALAPYTPTKETEGNREGDSSTSTATSGNLINDGDRDATLDFGFVIAEGAVVPTDESSVAPIVTPSPSTSDAPAAQTSAPAKGALASTGFNSISLLLFGLLLALVGGAAVTIVARHRSSARH
ncbi:SdrD B-like domain-containing protein [Arthrobacter psychrolactophilus]